MGEFIAVTIDPDLCQGSDACGRCVPVCPVAVFETAAPRPAVVTDNEDECILCDRCLQECPTDAVRIQKLYLRESD